MLEERELVGRVIAGDPEAEEYFFNLYKPRLYRAASYFLGSHDAEAEDITQETFIIALPKLKDYDFCAPIYAWLRQICLRLCYARVRRRKRLLMSVEEDLELFTRRLSIEKLQNESFEVQKQQKLDLLAKLKKHLNPDSRQIIELRNVQGMSYVHISEALDIPVGTVMSRLSRARDQMRKLVEDSALNDPRSELDL